MIDTDEYEKLIESIVISEEEYIDGSDNLLEDSQRLKACAITLLEEVKRLHVEVRALRKAQGYDMKFPVEVLAIDELLSENRQLRKENRQLRALFDSSNTVDGDD